MKVINTKRINDKIMEYAFVNSIHNALGIGLNAPVSIGAIIFDNYDGIDRARDFYKNKYKLNDDESKMAAMITSVLTGYNQLNNVPAEIMYEIVKNSKIFHKGDFDNNAYLQNIHFENQKVDRFELDHKRFEKYELFMYDEPIKNRNGIMIPRIGTFDYEFEFPLIKENNAVWMSITPSELISMQKPTNDAKGKVLTLECGMGCYAYNVSEKDNVESVTIVEIADEVIELFNKYILPQFKNKHKVKVIKADAYKFMEQLEDGVYDYCFADTWIGNLDVIPYLEMRKICKKFNKTKMAYWIETSLNETMMTFVFTNIIAEYYKNVGIKIPNINDAEDIPHDQFKTKEYIDKLLENEEITKPEHVDYYMKVQNIITMLENKK